MDVLEQTAHWMADANIHAKWGYSEEDTTCECQEAEQTMKHLLECPLLRQSCSNVDLIHYYEPAKECVKQWMEKCSDTTRREEAVWSGVYIASDESVWKCFYCVVFSL